MPTDNDTSAPSCATLMVRELPAEVEEALRNRGFSSEEKVTAAQAFDEFCSWHGLSGWGPHLRETMAGLSETFGDPEPSPSWQTAAAIAGRWERMTAVRVRKLANLLGLVPDHRGYSPDAVGLIEREIRSRACGRDPEASP